MYLSPYFPAGKPLQLARDFAAILRVRRRFASVLLQKAVVKPQQIDGFHVDHARGGHKVNSNYLGGQSGEDVHSVGQQIVVALALIITMMMVLHTDGCCISGG